MSAFSGREIRVFLAAAAALALAAALPLADQGYYLSLAVNVAMYAVLCTAWALFSGPTH